MSKLDAQEKRWKDILGDTAEGTQEEDLDVFFEYLKTNIKLPQPSFGLQFK